MGDRSTVLGVGIFPGLLGKMANKSSESAAEQR
jgi:hypothetical protein